MRTIVIIILYIELLTFFGIAAAKRFYYLLPLPVCGCGCNGLESRVTRWDAIEIWHDSHIPYIQLSGIAFTLNGMNGWIAIALADLRDWKRYGDFFAIIQAYSSESVYIYFSIYSAGFAMSDRSILHFKYFTRLWSSKQLLESPNRT